MSGYWRKFSQVDRRLAMEKNFFVALGSETLQADVLFATFLDNLVFPTSG
jgi:hypothetical protein